MRSLAALPLALSSGAALAAAPDALDYQAPAGCPDAASFAAAVEGRGASLAGPGGAGARLLVRIEPGEGGFTGSLVLRSGAEASEPRRVSGGSCAEVSDALAVVTAIALQRDAQAAPTAVGAATEAPQSAAPTAAAAAASSGAAPPLAVPPFDVGSSGPLEVVMVRKDLLVPSGRLVLGHISSYSLLAGVQLGAIPGVPLPRLDFDITRTNLVQTPGARAFVLGNQFRVRWTLLGLRQHRVEGYETSLLGLKAGIGSCTPFSYNPAGLILKACADFAVGMVDLSARPVSGGAKREETQGLATAGVELDLQYSVSRWLHLDLRAGTELWLNRISAEREDGSRLFQSPLLNAHVLVGVGLHF